MTTVIHKTSEVHSTASLGVGVTVAPFSVIGEGVIIHDRTEIGPHVVIEHSEIGSGCELRSGAIIGGPPQIIGTKDILSGVKIGNDTIVGEYATIHRSGKEGQRTEVGDNNYIMTFSHIGHDCILGDNVILTSYAGLSGHVTVGNSAVIGGHTGVHQFVCIGEFAMVGGMARLVKDVLPFFLTEGNPARLRGLNIVGLKRSGLDAASIGRLKKAYRLLSRSSLNVSQAVERIMNELEGPEITTLVEFIRSSKRGVTV